MSGDNIGILEMRAKNAEEDIVSLQQQLLELKKIIIKKYLREVNESLKKVKDNLINKLNQLEEINCQNQDGSSNINLTEKKEIPQKTHFTISKQIIEEKDNGAPEPIKANKKVAAKKKKAENTTNATNVDKIEEAPVDVGRLDLRIGKIINVKKHPEADSLYVEEIDVGEEKLRTVVSGLVKHVTLENMQDKLVLVLCNLKPAKMRGVTSEAMVMCASTPEKVELLVPPPGSEPGDLVYVDGYPRKPDAVMNPKKKIFETVAPDLKTNTQRIATYKNVPLRVGDKGHIVAPTLAEVQVK